MSSKVLVVDDSGLARRSARRALESAGFQVVEAEESCVVYGMPRSVVDAGLSDQRVPLDGMAQAIMDWV